MLVVWLLAIQSVAGQRFLSLDPGESVGEIVWTAPTDNEHVTAMEGTTLTTLTVNIHVIRNDYYSAPAKVDVYYEVDGTDTYFYFPGTKGNEGSEMPYLTEGMKLQITGVAQAEGATATTMHKELGPPDGTAAAGATVTEGKGALFVVKQVHEINSGIIETVGEGQGTCPPEVKALIILVVPCGKALTVGGTTLTKSMVEKAMLGTQEDSWASTHAVCSRQTSKVTGKVIGPLEVCPTGNGIGGDWSAVRTVLQSDYSADNNAYHYKILLQPDEHQSSIGSGQLGGPISWVRASYYDKAAMHLHEVGHNMYLHHSGVDGGNEYADTSSAMGFCCARRCFHFIHSWQLGFAEVVRKVAESELDSLVELEVPELGEVVKSGITIPSTVSPLHYFVISYRGSSGFDSFLEDRYKNQVYVHHYHGMSSKKRALVPRLVASVKVGKTELIPYSDLKLTWTAQADGIARVRVCKAHSSREACQAGATGPAPPPPGPTPAPTPAPQLPVWSSFFSDEQVGGLRTSEGMTGLGCKGQYCDQVRTQHNPVIRVDLSKAVTLQSANDVDDLSCGEHMAISRLTCKEAQCGRIEVECAPVMSGILSLSALSTKEVWVPQALHGAEDGTCDAGSVMTSILCAGTSCAKKLIKCSQFDRTTCSASDTCASLGMECSVDGCGKDCGACGATQSCMGGSGRCVRQSIETDWINKNSHMVDSHITATGMKCQGKFCANVKILMMGITVNAGEQDTALSGWISDNKGAIWPWNDKADDLSADCPEGYVVSRVECRGKNCDDLRMHCRKPIDWELDAVGQPWHGPNWFSDEGAAKQECPRGFAMTGLECRKSSFWCLSGCGHYCDDKKIRCRQILHKPGAVGTANGGIANSLQIEDSQAASLVCDEACRDSEFTKKVFGGVGVAGGAVTTSMSCLSALAIMIVSLW